MRNIIEVGLGVLSVGVALFGPCWAHLSFRRMQARQLNAKRYWAQRAAIVECAAAIGVTFGIGGLNPSNDVRVGSQVVRLLLLFSIVYFMLHLEKLELYEDP